MNGIYILYLYYHKLHISIHINFQEHFGNFQYKYTYSIPVQKNRGANYNSGYIEGYQRALRDLERNTNNMLERNNKILNISFDNYDYY